MNEETNGKPILLILIGFFGYLATKSLPEEGHSVLEIIGMFGLAALIALGIILLINLVVYLIWFR